MNTPTVVQLRYAVAVADERHFGRAAQACFVSQPALSAQIRELEAKLRVQLFERTSRGVLLTPAGALVVDRARRILRELDDLCDVAAEASGDLRGPLRFGVIPTVGPYVLPAVVRAVADAHPALELYLREDRTDALVAQLQAGDLDVLLLALPVERVGVEQLPLYEEPFLLAVPRDHPLARRRRCDVDALADERLVLLEDGHCLRDQALAVCSPSGSGRPVEVQGTSLPTVVQMVGAGLGVTLLPLSTVHRDARPIERVAVRELRPAPTRTVGLAWRASSARSAAYARLAELVGAAAVDSIGTAGGPGRVRALLRRPA